MADETPAFPIIVMYPNDGELQFHENMEAIHFGESMIVLKTNCSRRDFEMFAAGYNYGWDCGRKDTN